MTVTTSYFPTRDLSGHHFDTVSHAELKRRWSAISAAMEEAGIDALVMQNISDSNGAATRWFADMQAQNGYPVSVVFERDGTLTMHTHGSQGGSREMTELPAVEGQREHARHVTTYGFISVHYCESYEPDSLLPVLKRYARGTIGLVAPMQMTASFADSIRGSLPGATFVNASDLVDRVKIPKSEEELAGIRLCAQTQEEVLKALVTAAVPGATEYECVIAARRRAYELGSDAGVVGFGSAPHGTPAPFHPQHRGSRVLQEGDRMSILVETNGPGGWHTEIGRMAVIGTADEQIKDEVARAAEMQDFTMGLFQPGRAAADIFDAYSARLRAEGLPPETRLHCHGQGLDIVERPLIRSDETFTIAGPLNMACHPSWIRDGINTWLCDNFVVAPDGSFERLTTVPRVVLELG